MDSEAFYEADDQSFEIIKPELQALFRQFGIETDIQKTEDGDTIDAEVTAITRHKNYIIYTIEIKVRQKPKYTFQLFYNAEKNKDGTVYSNGIFIKQKKIQSLIKRAKENNSIPYYCMRFTDAIIALWHITELTPTGEIKTYHDLYNVHKGYKTLQTHKTLSLVNADVLYDAKKDVILQNLKKNIVYFPTCEK